MMALKGSGVDSVGISLSTRRDSIVDSGILSAYHRVKSIDNHTIN